MIKSWLEAADITKVFVLLKSFRWGKDVEFYYGKQFVILRQFLHSAYAAETELLQETLEAQISMGKRDETWQEMREEDRSSSDVQTKARTVL